MTTTPSKEAQLNEAEARARAGIEPGERATALDTVGDGAPLDPGQPHAPPAAQQEPAQREPPAPKSQFDGKRDAIAARFRTARVEDADVNGDDEISELARAGMPPDFQQAPILLDDQPQPGEPQPAEGAAATGAQQQVAPAEPATTIKLTVHGKEIELPIEEVRAKAQIALASENILDEAKTKAREIDAILRDAREKAQRQGQDGQHQAAPNTTQSTEQPHPPAAAPLDQGNDIEKLIEAIQFGDPNEAKTLLQKTIAEAKTSPEAIAAEVEKGLYNARLRDEGARAGKMLSDFREKHADLAKDPMANAAIEAKLFELQRDDLQKLGLDTNRIRPDGLPATPADIAMAHRHYRAIGMNVRSVGTMLENARDDFLKWKGVPNENPAPQPVPAARDRSVIVAEEKARRARLRGQVGV
jgi:hypothetical protein